MARYFFDIHDGAFHRDMEGSECVDLEAVHKKAKRVLPDIARDVIPSHGDQHAFTVLVRDEQNSVVYTATLTFTGLWVDTRVASR